MRAVKHFFTVLARSKDEPHVQEWVQHYTEEGADQIIIIDDNSEDLSVYRGLPSHVSVLHPPGGLGPNKFYSRKIDAIYQELRSQTEWLLFCDIDEFITSRLRPEKTIRWELENTFSKAHCVKVPWIMMSSNGREKDPVNLRAEIVTRWNHDLAHPHPNTKFRCRLDSIEVKSIFRPEIFPAFNDHRPEKPLVRPARVIDSVSGKRAPLDAYHVNLRETSISQSILICHHYRLTSIAAAKRKINSNKFYKNMSLSELLATDYPEILDETLAQKAKHREIPSEDKLTARVDSPRLGTDPKTRITGRNDDKPSAVSCSPNKRSLIAAISDLRSAIHTCKWLAKSGAGMALNIDLLTQHIRTSRRIRCHWAAKEPPTLVREFRRQVRQGTFDTDWFTSKIPMWLLIFESENLYTKAPLNCLEIGSWQGLSALFLLTQLPLANLTCVDTWGEAGSPENGQRTDLAPDALNTFKTNLAAYSNKCNAFQGTSDQYFANRHVETHFDFVYIDGSHRAGQVLKDAVNAFSSLRRDGIMIFDDLSWKQRHHALGNPAAGIIAFLNLHQGLFQVIACTSKQLAIKKTKAISGS